MEKKQSYFIPQFQVVFWIYIIHIGFSCFNKALIVCKSNNNEPENYRSVYCRWIWRWFRPMLRSNKSGYEVSGSSIKYLYILTWWPLRSISSQFKYQLMSWPRFYLQVSLLYKPTVWCMLSIPLELCELMVQSRTVYNCKGEWAF